MGKCRATYFVAALIAMALAVAPKAPAAADASGAAAVQKVEGGTLAGSVTGVSRKARMITLDVDKVVEIVRFDDATVGLEHARAGEAAVIDFRLEGGERVATVIKPKLAKLPAGVVEIGVAEMTSLVAQGPEQGNYFLVDSRPDSRYQQGHIPTAVSIPVPKLEKEGSALFPVDAREKNTLLVFYCGGPT